MGHWTNTRKVKTLCVWGMDDIVEQDCGHCGAKAYTSPDDGRWIYTCHGRYDSHAASCCNLLRCNFVQSGEPKPCRGECSKAYEAFLRGIYKEDTHIIQRNLDREKALQEALR